MGVFQVLVLSLVWIICTGQESEKIISTQPTNIVAITGVKVALVKHKVIYQSTLPTYFRAEWKIDDWKNEEGFKVPKLVLKPENSSSVAPNTSQTIAHGPTALPSQIVKGIENALEIQRQVSKPSGNRELLVLQTEKSADVEYHAHGPNVQNQPLTQGIPKGYRITKQTPVEELRIENFNRLNRIQKYKNNFRKHFKMEFGLPNSGEVIQLPSITGKPETLDRERRSIEKESLINATKILNKEERGKRVKRGLLSFCCDVAYKSDVDSIQVDEERIENYMNVVRFSLSGEQQEITNMQHSITDLNSAVKEDMGIIRKDLLQFLKTLQGEEVTMGHVMEMQNHMTESIDFLLLQSEYIHRNISITECRTGLIPHFIVSVDILKARIANISEQLRFKQSRYELAIPQHEYSKYYNHKLASCMFSNESIMIQIKIPLKRIDLEWQIYSVNPMPFVYNNSICHFEDLPSYVAASSNRKIRTISSTHHHHCTQVDFGLCYLPQFPQQYQHNERCMETLFYGASLIQVTEHCKFKCTRNEKPVIIQINPHEFSILNPGNHTLALDVSCKNKTKNTKAEVGKIGAYVLHLPCNCSGTVIE